MKILQPPGWASPRGYVNGVAARGTSSEKYFNAMLKDGGLKPEDVTYVAVGAPNTAYTALAIGKQIDAVIMYQPLPQLCSFNKTCEMVIDMTVGEGPKSLEATIGETVGNQADVIYTGGGFNAYLFPSSPVTPFVGGAAGGAFGRKKADQYAI